MLIAIEGIDGSGKGTQSALLVNHLRGMGRKAELLSFPRYGTNPFSAAIAQYLNGQFGPTQSVAPTLAALLYAGDRFCNKPTLCSATSDSIVVCDRYVDSNVAHQAAKLPQSEWPTFIDWVDSVEYDAYGLPRPALTVLLSVPTNVAISLIAKKSERSYTSLKADGHEADHGYLHRCAEVYRLLSDKRERAYCTIECVAAGELLSPDAIAGSILEEVGKRL